MARLRKRFYVAVPNGIGPLKVLALKFTPEPALYSHSFSRIVGPYRTRAAADMAVSSPSLLDFPVRRAEGLVTKFQTAA